MHKRMVLKGCGNTTVSPTSTECHDENEWFCSTSIIIGKGRIPLIRWVVFALTAAFASFLAWIIIGSILGEHGDVIFSLTTVVALQNCVIIVMLAAVLARLNNR